MSAKAVSEASGKRLLNSVLTTSAKSQFASINESSNFDEVLRENPWLNQTVRIIVFFCVTGMKLTISLSILSHQQKLVVKPDQLIKRRGKLGLIKVNVDYPEVKKWILERIGKDTQVGSHDSCFMLVFLSSPASHAFPFSFFLLRDNVLAN